MSFDLDVTVPRGITLDQINGALGALEAPFVVGDLRLLATADGTMPDWSAPFEEGAYQAFPLLPELSFQSLADATVAFDGERYQIMTGSSGAEVAYAVALAMARCSGEAVIFADKTGEEHQGKLLKLERQVRNNLGRLWRDLKRKAAAVPEAVAAYRRPRPDETLWAHYERVALHEQPADAVATYLRERAALALAEGRDAEIDRLVALAPPGPAPLEPLLDACSGADRPDVGRRVLLHLHAHAREHLLASVGYIGFRAVPYVRFLTSLGAIELDAALLAQARSRAADAEMRALIDDLAARAPR